MRRLLAEHRCPRCEVHKVLCFCSEIPSIPLATRVLILMHTAEEVLTSNTARLVAKALPNCELRIRGRKDQPMSTEGFVETGRSSLLLFPSPFAAELNAEFVARLEPPITLIVPDGSWTQAKRFVRRDRALAGIPHVRVPAGAPSAYRLRAQSHPGSLCTLEAVARAIGVLESPAVQARLEQLLQVLVERTLRSRGVPRSLRPA